MSGPAAIPTLYKGLMFRSRLEATWAAFFDEIGWDWEYEPFDLSGYIPDFVLKFASPLLVEVKPAMSLAELVPHQEKIDRSSWDKEALIVGASVFPSEIWKAIALGRLKDKEYGWGEAVFFKCSMCSTFSVFSPSGSYGCRVCGEGDGDHHIMPVYGFEFDEPWRRAKNATQWHSR